MCVGERACECVGGLGAADVVAFHACCCLFSLFLVFAEVVAAPAGQEVEKEESLCVCDSVSVCVCATTSCMCDAGMYVV